MPDAFRADLSTSGDDDNDVNDDDDRGGDTSLRQNRNRRKSSEDSNHSHGKTEKVNDHYLVRIQALDSNDYVLYAEYEWSNSL